MIAVKELSCSKHLIAVALKELREKDGFLEDRIVDEGALVDVITGSRRSDPAHDGRAGRATGRSRAMSVRKHKAPGSELVQVGRTGLQIALQYPGPIIEIIYGDEQYVHWPCRIA